ncbi:MAG: hypothetical protein APG11_01336 [Candidatus Methanofastidiosum methylothiophilum]|uniref:Uncharacterized protein n=1 Tax=Candidatus Methanofastidiosum methylothiophilum TaxID=1705564 RepID=A0A150IQX6_9EURY|nr:MAG: hypothetical protein APG11_01336 [Candidatus Methanofastidiosum methylthiophilus]
MCASHAMVPIFPVPIIPIAVGSLFAKYFDASKEVAAVLIYVRYVPFMTQRGAPSLREAKMYMPLV